MTHPNPLPQSGSDAVVRLAGAPEATPLSKSQKAFNRLIEKIELQREALARWQAFLPQLQQRVAAELDPLESRCSQARLALAMLFDAAHDRAGTTKREQAKLAALVIDECTGLLQDDAVDHDAVVALHDKYSDTSHAERREEESRFLNDLAVTAFGVDLGDAEKFDSPEALRAALHRKLLEEKASREPPAPAAPRKSAKALAREARAAAEARAATLSVREIYRKLASALHPDRETDATERARKTDLMQQVNKAYADTDLLRLLELQIRIEQIDRTALGSFSEQRLRHYNQVLAEQSAQLEHEIEALTMPYLQQTGAFGGEGLKPETLSRHLDGDIATLRNEARRIEHDLKRLSDRATLKAWLRSVRVQRRHGEDDSIATLFDAFDVTR